MKWIAQEEGSRLCGQVAVAVVARKPLKKVIEVIGHSKGTTTRDLVKALKKFGLKCPSRLQCKRTSPLAIAKLINKKWGGSWHWVVVYKDKIYDGYCGTEDGKVRWPAGSRITSYLPITR